MENHLLPLDSEASKLPKGGREADDALFAASGWAGQGGEQETARVIPNYPLKAQEQPSTLDLDAPVDQWDQAPVRRKPEMVRDDNAKAYRDGFRER